MAADGSQQTMLTVDALRPGVRWAVEREDAVEALRRLPPESVNLVVTDPAYESLEKHRAKGTTTRLAHSKSSSNDWFAIFPNFRFPDLFREMFRVLRPNSHCYVLCDQETMFAIKPMGESAGFTFWKPLIWDKGRIGMGYHYRARYELVLFFEKGKRKLHDLGIPDVLNFEPVRDGYPTEKPPSLLQTLIRQSSVAGDIVLDPFSGSGSTGEAALVNDRRFLGFDVSGHAVDLAGKRLVAL